MGGANGFQALAGYGNLAAVEKLDGHAGAWRECSGQEDVSLSEFAGVVGVAGDGLLRVDEPMAIGADALKMERRRELQRNFAERLCAVVAEGEASFSGKRLVARREMEVKVVAGDVEGAALLVGSFGDG